MRWRFSALIPVCFLLFLTSSLSVSATWVVSPDGTGDWPTIQVAIDSSSPGDTILLGCGTYFESDLQMKSGITLRSETGEADCVTVDAAASGRGMVIDNASGETRIEGITFTNGIADGASFPDYSGGAIYCRYSEPVIERCVFTDNYASTQGGAILLDHSSPTIDECVFLSNSVGPLGEAGGLYCSVASWPIVSDCLFESNQGNNGGAVRCGAAGGIPENFENCEFVSNIAFYRGGAVYSTSQALPDFQFCSFRNNSSSSGGGAFFLINSGAAILTNCTLFDNGSDYGGGSIEARAFGEITIDNSIIAFGYDGPAVWCDASSSADLTCSDLYGNAGGDWVGCIAGQEGTMGNFSSDPLFCDAPNGDLTLSADSPCLDAPGCGQVGAFGEGCGGTTGVEQTSWGEIKRIFR